MLEQTFLFLPGINDKIEQRLWCFGIRSWDDLLAAEHIPSISKERLLFWKHRLRQAQQSYEQENGVMMFTKLLGPRHTWRLYNEIMSNPRFIDIETTEFYGDITVVGVSDGDFYQAFVKGRNLNRQSLQHAFKDATCIITFNGSSFDLPIIERSFPGIIPLVPHLDLRHICAQAKLRGGLKRIEQHLMISRAAAIRDKNGTDAIMLWHQHVLGDNNALQELVDYNAADVLNLMPLAELVISALWKNVRHKEPLPFTPILLSVLEEQQDFSRPPS